MTIVKTSKLSRLQKELAMSSIDHFMTTVMPRMKNMYIKVVGVKDLDIKEGVDGDCIWTDDLPRPKDFLIRVNSSLSIKDFVTTIMHEMVHVKQYARREMFDMRTNAKGKRVTNWKGRKVDTDRVSYKNQPWEVEAFKLQDKLTEEFLNK